MTDDELLIESYKEILAQTKENLAYFSKDNFDYTEELTEDCKDIIAILEDILSEVDGVESLKKLDEEDYAFMYEMLNAYAEVFIVDGTGSKEKLAADQAKFEKLMDLLEVLEANYVPQDYDDDSDDAEDEESEEQD